MDATNSILDLPIEVLEPILKLLRWYEVVRLEATCTLFQQLARRLVTTLLIQYGMDDTKLMRCIRKFGDSLQELRVYSYLSRDDVLSICKQTTRLTKLEIYAPLKMAKDVSIGLFKLTGLQELEISHNCHLQTLGEVLSLTKLTRLAIDRAPDVFFNRLTRLSNLIELEISPNKDNLQLVNSNWNFLADLASVKSLILHKQVDNISNLFTPISQMAQLTALKLYKVPTTFMDAMRTIGELVETLPLLQSLILLENTAPLMIDSLTGLTRLETIIDIQNVSYLSRLQQLKAIHIEHSSAVTGDQILDHLQHLPNLEKATLLCRTFDMSCKYDKLTSCSKLTQLELNFPEDIASQIGKNQLAVAQAETFKRIARLTTLKNLSIEFYSKFEELTAMTNLRSLTIWAVRRASIETFKDVTKLTNLNEFNLSMAGVEYTYADIYRHLFPVKSHMIV